MVILRRISLVFAALVAVLVTAAVIGVELDLAKLRGRIEPAIGDALERKVKFDGRLVLVVGMRPSIDVGGIEIANPSQFGGAAESEESDGEVRRLAFLERARVEVALVPLLFRRLVVREISAEGASIDMAVDRSGRVNWEFGEDPVEEAGEAEGESKPAGATLAEDLSALNLFIRSASIEKLSLRDVKFSYHDERDGAKRHYQLDELTASAATDEPLELQLHGSLRGVPIRSALRTGDPDALLVGDPFGIEIETELAETEIRMNANLDGGEFGLLDAAGMMLRGVTGQLPDERLGEISVEIRSEKLDGLDGLLDTALPPLGPYTIAASLEAFGTGRYVADLAITIGEASRLVGKGTLDTGATPSRVEIALNADTIQLNDFDLGDWSPFSDKEEAPPSSDSADARHTARAIFDPDVLRRLNGGLDVRVGRVLAGSEVLGAGHLGIRLADGRMDVDPLTLEVPGGAVAMSAGLKPGHERTDASFSLLMKRFDYGILARRVDPETPMGGYARLDVSLRSSGPNARSLMINADGHLDIAVFPHAFEAGIIDLWAVNVLPAVLSAVDGESDDGEESKINCIVGHFDLEGGVMRSDRLMLDTTRMTVEGHAEVDFETEKVDVELVPTAKHAEFFTLATPVAIDGTISDFDVDVKAGDLIGTVIRFVTSVIHVPLRRLFEDEPPKDELEHCLAALDLRGKPRKKLLGIF
jgi:uncharacterized protein involved in outer membrane biogenesis